MKKHISINKNIVINCPICHHFIKLDGERNIKEQYIQCSNFICRNILENPYYYKKLKIKKKDIE